MVMKVKQFWTLLINQEKKLSLSLAWFSLSSDLGLVPPKPRLCHLSRSDLKQEFGFNLFKRRDVEGQFVGGVESGSAAHQAGLREEDRVVELDGDNIENKSHKKLVKKIK